MRSLRILMARNLRKRRGQAMAMLLLALLGAALLNLGLILATGYGPFIDDKLAQANAPEGAALLPAGSSADGVIALLAKDGGVRSVEVEPVLGGMVDTRFDAEVMSTAVIVADVDQPPVMGAWRQVSSTDAVLERPIFAPQVYDTAGGYDLGDPLTFATPSGSVTFHIQGFLEHPTLGMPAMGAVGFAVPASEYAALAADGGSGLRPMELVKVQANQGADASDVIQRAMVAHNDANPHDRAHSFFDSSIDLMRTGATIGSSIFSGGFVAFAVIILVVALVVMWFLLVNAITDDMRSLGVLRACGFSTGGVMLQLAGTFALATLVGSILGVAVSYLALGALTGALSFQTGLNWNPGFNLGIAAITVVALTAVVFLIALVAARRLRRRTTIEALSGGARAHTFSRNPLPLATANGGLNALLGLKTALQRIPQQVLVGLTVTVVAFTTMIAIGLSTNVLGNQDAFRRLVVGDVPEAQIHMVDAASVPAMVADAATTPGVDRAFLSETSGTTINGERAVVQIMDDYGILRYDSTYQGRMPRHDDEVSLGSSLARRLRVGVGERIVLDIGGYSAEYLVSGLTSSSRGLGMSADITTAGMRRADPGYEQRVVSLYIAKGHDIDAIIADLARRHADEVESQSNVQSSMDGQLSGYQSMVGVLSAVIVTFMLAVVILVIALIVSTMVRQGRRSYGILKAVGFTSADLRRQTLMTWVPVIGIGALAGGLIGTVGLNPTLAGLLRFIGIARADFSVAWWIVAALTLGLTALAALVIRVSARSLRRVSAYALVSE